MVRMPCSMARIAFVHCKLKTKIDLWYGADAMFYGADGNSELQTNNKSAICAMVRMPRSIARMASVTIKYA